jgi:hypothetical protein
MTPPVVLVAFNRLEVVRRTLAAIREVAPPELFLLADGPRPSHSDDAERCAAVRAELDTVDWPCRVHRLYRDDNLGPDVSVELGLDWVFEQTEEAIILEDDCLPNADFYRFCNALLERYRDTNEVWQICGRAPNMAKDVFAGASYTFTAFGPIWGWATWRRAWTAHRRLYPNTHRGTPPAAAGALDLRGSRLLTPGARRYFGDVGRDSAGAAFGWDSCWARSVVRERGLVAIPRSNLIVNIGFGADATNVTRAVPQHPLEPIAWPLEHPSELAVNPALERVVERTLVIYMGRTARFVARLLRGTRAGAVIRGVVGALRDRRTRAVVR